ncbi:MAG: M23 family metallopeptidase [Betaproteobacteria bacterium]|nr:M23 family metallopeptidase [Betaproteobacteria bacterium]
MPPAIAAALFASHLAAAESSPGEPSNRQPLIEVASFGAAPVSGVDEDRGPRPQPGDILHPSGAQTPESGPRHEIETRAASGESWIDLLKRASETLEAKILGDASGIHGIDLLPPLVPGKYLRLRSGDAARRVDIEYVVDAGEAYSIVLDPAGVQVRQHASDPRLVARIRSDPAKASLFTATDAIGLPEEIVLQLVEIFSGDVDFHRELHYGYRATIAYEVFYREGHIDRAGKILAVEFIIRNRRLQAFYYDDGRGDAGYYTEAGKSMRKLFRKAPIEFSRITSDYTLARYHPVLGLWRAHRGIDYAAPLGTRVIATADGVVDFMGERGEYGNLVILRHYARFLTFYGHLNAFAADIGVGRRVKNGQVIGYVGMTGLATGPHVHYEFHVQNGPGDWVSIAPPAEVEAPPLDTPAFFRAVRDYRDKLQVAANAHFVILD